MDKGNFTNWLISEMEKRDWSQSDLSIKIGTSRQAVSNMIRRQSLPLPETCERIAQAFKIPVEEVYRQAGLLTQKSPTEKIVERIYYQLSLLDERDRQEVEQFIAFKLSKVEGTGKHDGDNKGSTGEVE